MFFSFPSWLPAKETRTDTTNRTPLNAEGRASSPPRPVSGASGSRRDDDTPATDIILAFTLGAASSAGAILAWRRWGMRLGSAEWITPNEFARRRWIRGVVTSVGDADDFRLYHTPGIGWRWPLKVRRVPTKRKDLKDQTIHVRIAGVDAPEGAHYGRPGQPHAEESLGWLRKRILGKTVYCQLIRKDQYGRVVGIPFVPRPFLPMFLTKRMGSPLALEMLQAGVAKTYTESGGEYGAWGRKKFLWIEEEAKSARRGMWRNGVDIETPGEYKRRYAVALGAPSKEDGREGEDENERKRWMSRLTAMLK